MLVAAPAKPAKPAKRCFLQAFGVDLMNVKITIEADPSSTNEQKYEKPGTTRL